MDGGCGPADIVKRLRIAPSLAMDLHRDWQVATAAEVGARPLREALALRQRLLDDQWSYDDFTAAYDRLCAADEVYADVGFTCDAALALLRVAADRFDDFRDAVEALETLPVVEQLEHRAAVAKVTTQIESQRAADATARAHHSMAQATGLMPYVDALQLARELVRFVRGDPDDLRALMTALAVAPDPDAQTWEALLDYGTPQGEAGVRRLLAAWAATEAPDLLVPRSRHEDAVARAQSASQTTRMMFAMAAAAAVGRAR